MTAVVLLMIGSAFYTFGGVAVGMLTKTPAGFTRVPGTGVTVEPNWAAVTAIATGVVCSVAIVFGALLTYTGVKKENQDRFCRVDSVQRSRIRQHVWRTIDRPRACDSRKRAGAIMETEKDASSTRTRLT